MGQQRYSILNPSARPLITIDLTPGVLRVLDYMQDYDVVPASYVKAQFESYTFTKQIITRLAKAHFVRVPSGYSHLNARYRPRPLELTDLARKALLERGLLRQRERMNDHFSHAYLRSVIQHSFDRAAQEIRGLTRHTEAEIIAHPKTPARTRNEPHPSWFEALGKTVRPDAPLFGYEYRVGGRAAFMYFHGFEADRATERQTARDDFGRKTIQDMILRYADYFARGVFREKYGLTQVTVPIITIGTQRLANMLDLIRTEVPDERIQRRFILKALPNFIADEPLPPPTAHMVTEPWQRVDGPFSIIDTLKHTAERKAA